MEIPKYKEKALSKLDLLILAATEARTSCRNYQIKRAIVTAHAWSCRNKPQEKLDLEHIAEIIEQLKRLRLAMINAQSEEDFARWDRLLQEGIALHAWVDEELKKVREHEKGLYNALSGDIIPVDWWDPEKNFLSRLWRICKGG